MTMDRKTYGGLHTGALCALGGLLFSTSAIAMPGGNPDAVIRIMDANGMAPFAVHVHALDSAWGAGDETTARFEWTFGDPGSDHNRLEGWNAAHVYDEPGTYTVHLKITNEDGNVDTTTRSVTVTPDTRQRLYVSAQGNDSNDGSSPSEAIRSMSRAEDLGDDDMMILFERGDTFDVDDAGDFSYDNIVIGAYGNGSLPKLRWVGSMGLDRIIKMNMFTTSNVVVQDLHFDSIYPNTDERNICIALTPAGDNFTVRRCTFGHVTDAINNERVPCGFYAYDNSATISNGLRAYFVWVRGDDHTYVNNEVNGSLHEHNIRIAGSSRVNITGNDLRNHPKTTVWFMTGEHAWISQNTLRDGPVTIGPDPYLPPQSNRAKFGVHERNHHIKDTSGPAAIEFHHGAEDITVRNNLIEAHGQACIDIAGWSNDQQRTTRRVRIVNNTGVNDEITGRFVDAEADTDDILVQNNLYAAPLLTTGVGRTANMFVEADDLSGFDVIRNNVWAVPYEFEWVDNAYHYVWPYWSDAQGMLTPQQWAGFPQTIDEVYTVMDFDGGWAPPGSDVSATHAVPFPGVHVDYWGNDRPSSGPWSAGCVDINVDDPPDNDPDLDNDGVVNTNDLLILVDAWGNDDHPADIDGNGIVGNGDLVLLLAEWDPEDNPADIDGDGTVGAGDLLLVIQDWGSTNSPADINLDGFVGSDDLVIVIALWD